MAVRNVYFIPCLKVKNTIIGTEVFKVRFVSSFAGIFKGIHFDTLNKFLDTFEYISIHLLTFRVLSNTYGSFRYFQNTFQNLYYAFETLLCHQEHFFEELYLSKTLKQ